MMKWEPPKGCCYPPGEVHALDVQHHPVSTPVVYWVPPFVRNIPSSLCWNEVAQNQGH